MAEPSTTTPVEAATAERDRLLATKLHVPRPRPGFLARPRLLERLAEGTAGALTLVCAPAEFGKTSLLGDWARRSRQPVAWLSLDASGALPTRRTGRRGLMHVLEKRSVRGRSTGRRARIGT